MTREEISSASIALLHWIETQGISAEEAVPVLVVTISGLVKGIARRNDADPGEGTQIIAAMIKETVEAME